MTLENIADLILSCIISINCKCDSNKMKIKALKTMVERELMQNRRIGCYYENIQIRNNRKYIIVKVDIDFIISNETFYFKYSDEKLREVHRKINNRS